MKSRFWQMCWLPARQAEQVPSQISGMTVTGRRPTSPDTGADCGDGAGCLVAEDQGGRTRASMSPCTMCRSVPHSPQ